MGMNDDALDTLHTVFKSKYPEYYAVFFQFTHALANSKGRFIPMSEVVYAEQHIIDAMKKAHEIATTMKDEKLMFLTANVATFAAYVRPDDVAQKLNAQFEPSEEKLAIERSKEIESQFPYLVRLIKNVDSSKQD